jgi:hypothetical protein
MTMPYEVVREMKVIVDRKLQNLNRTLQARLEDLLNTDTLDAGNKQPKPIAAAPDYSFFGKEFPFAHETHAMHQTQPRSRKPQERHVNQNR